MELLTLTLNKITSFQFLLTLLELKWKIINKIISLYFVSPLKYEVEFFPKKLFMGVGGRNSFGKMCMREVKLMIKPIPSGEWKQSVYPFPHLCQFLEGNAGKEWGDLFKVVCSFYIKHKLKSKIFNGKKSL